jgi:hypothetical protein
MLTSGLLWRHTEWGIEWSVPSVSPPVSPQDFRHGPGHPARKERFVGASVLSVRMGVNASLVGEGYGVSKESPPLDRNKRFLPSRALGRRVLLIRLPHRQEGAWPERPGAGSLKRLPAVRDPWIEGRPGRPNRVRHARLQGFAEFSLNSLLTQHPHPTIQGATRHSGRTCSLACSLGGEGMSAQKQRRGFM